MGSHGANGRVVAIFAHLSTSLFRSFASVLGIGGIAQFTMAGDPRKGYRPSFQMLGSLLS